MNSTTMNKFFTKKNKQTEKISNPIYVLATFDNNPLNINQDKSGITSKKRRNSVASADAKFSLTKNSQRFKSINNLFTLKE